MGQLLDAAIAALGATAVGAVLLYHASPELANPTSAAGATQVAFAAGDLIMVAALVGACALTGWRFERAWVLAGAGPSPERWATSRTPITRRSASTPLMRRSRAAGRQRRC